MLRLTYATTVESVSLVNTCVSPVKSTSILQAKSNLQKLYQTQFFATSLEDHSVPDGFNEDSYRGRFRDMNLWMKSDTTTESDDFWVVEFANMTQMAAERARALKNSLEIELETRASLVLKGEVPATMGWDACGGEIDKQVISVPQGAIPLSMMRQQTQEEQVGIQSALTINQDIADLIGRVSKTSIINTVTELSTLTPRTRNSYSPSLSGVVSLVETKLKTYGFTTKKENFEMRRRTISNIDQVYGEIVGSQHPDEIVVVGAHLDSINRNYMYHDAPGSPGLPGYSSSTDSHKDAPGADDNGSGSSVLVELAKVIQQSGLKFKRTLRLCFFTGEEQGLHGSRYWAQKWKSEGVQIHAMINVDMIAYKDPPPNTEPAVGFMSRMSNAQLTSEAKDVSRLYVPTLAVGDTQGCCSDQQSFYEQGFASVGWFETRTNSVRNPHYHRNTDTVDTLDQSQITLQCQSVIAFTATKLEVDGAPAPGTPAPPTLATPAPPTMATPAPPTLATPAPPTMATPAPPTMATPEPPTPSTPEPPPCVNTAGWNNGGGHTCAVYEKGAWCKNKVFWGLVWSHNYPNKNCCACGKGSDDEGSSSVR